MALVLAESFDSGIPAGFASVVLGTGGAGALTATYNSGAQAVDLEKGGLNGAWVLDAAGYQPNLRVLLDIEQLSADNGQSSASGIGLSYRAQGEDFHHVVAIFPESNVVAMYRGNPSSPIDLTAVDGGTSPAVPALAGRRNLELRVVQTAGTSRQVQVYVDGAAVLIGAVTSISPGAALLPGVFLRDCSYRLHSVEVYSDAALFVPQGSAFSAVGARLAPGLPAGNGAVLGGLVRHDAADGGPDRIAGTVQIDGTPVTPAARRVRLHDQASGRVVRETWSDAAGAYSFEKLARRPYYVIAFDHTGLHDPVARDQRIPVP